MMPIFKKGDPGLASSYRGIMMINVLSKVYHKWLRQQIMKRLSDVRMDTHLGGFPGQQAVYGAQCMQVFARLAHAHHLPAAGLFVDVQGAYHFLVRELVMGNIDPEDENLILENLASWKAETKGVRLWLKIPSVLHRLRFPERLIALLREIHVDTWSRLPHLPDLLRSSRGSRPGSPLADAIYAILMIDVHSEMYRILEGHEGITKSFEQLEICPFAVTWADDLALPIVAPSNCELLEYAAYIAKKVYCAFERRGLLLNMQPGKTMLVPAFRGPDAPNFRKTYLLSFAAGIDVEISKQRKILLRCACSYKHLGMMFTPDGEVSYEVRCRLGQAVTALNDLRPVLFRNKRISIRTRLRLFESLIISRLCYGISAWGHVAPRLVRQIESFILRAQRQICGYPIQHGPSNDEMIGRYRLPSLSHRMSMARLKYATKLWKVGPATLQQMLLVEQTTSSTSWWTYLVNDLQWCQQLCGDDFPVVGLDTEELAKSWTLHPKAWTRALRMAFKKATLQEATAAEVRAHHSDIFRILAAHGAVIEGHNVDGPPQPDAFPCPSCTRSFSTVQGLTAHRRFAHQYRAPEAQFVINAVCPHCLKFFWSKARVRQHLAYAPRNGQPNPCFAALQLRGFLPEAEPDPDPKLGVTAGINRRDSLQAAGPMPEIVDAELAAIQTVEQELDINEASLKSRFNIDEISLPFVEQISADLTRATLLWFVEVWSSV